MLVVADTSPLNYLAQIECEHVLPQLYGRITAPAAVSSELRHTAVPDKVRRWLDSTPVWLEIRDCREVPTIERLGLGPGETAAIELANELRAGLLLIDERKGSRVARERGLLDLTDARVPEHAPFWVYRLSRL